MLRQRGEVARVPNIQYKYSIRQHQNNKTTLYYNQWEIEEVTAQRRKKMDQSQNRKKNSVNSHISEKQMKRVAIDTNKKLNVVMGGPITVLAYTGTLIFIKDIFFF